jgi:hypothetical protein
LGGEAGVHKEAFFVVPLFKAAVVIQFKIILDDKWHDVIFQALLKEDQTAYTTVSVLEGMDVRSKATWKATMSSKVLKGKVSTIIYRFVKLFCR